MKMSDLVLKAPKHADARSKLERKRESRERKLRGCNGNCVVAFKPISLYRANCKDLRIEADIHCLSTSGSKRSMAECLANHYAERKHTGTRKWSSKMVQDALSLFPKNEKKSGRKRKRKGQ